MKATEILGKTVTVRSVPAVVSGSDTMARVSPYSTIDIVAVVQDAQHPEDPSMLWLQLPNNTYVNYIYPPNGKRFDLEQPPPTDPPPVPEAEIDHLEAVYKDGTRKIFVEQP